MLLIDPADDPLPAVPVAEPEPDAEPEADPAPALADPPPIFALVSMNWLPALEPLPLVAEPLPDPDPDVPTAPLLWSAGRKQPVTVIAL